LIRGWIGAALTGATSALNHTPSAAVIRSIHVQNFRLRMVNLLAKGETAINCRKSTMKVTLRPEWFMVRTIGLLRTIRGNPFVLKQHGPGAGTLRFMNFKD
jgi:hypothetical protein